MSKIHTPVLKRSEQGMVSIVTTMVLMVVISLIALGFAQISRRNQRESLDRQLSTQAFYAAETGINDARKVISDAVAAGTPISDKTTCDGTGVAGFYAGLNPDIDTSLGVKYSCLLVDSAPTSLSYTDIGMAATVIPMISASGTPLDQVELHWQSKETGGSPTSGCPTVVANVFTPAPAWTCGYGVLRVDIVPTDGSSMTIDSLQRDTMTFFAVPFSSGGVNTVNYPTTVPASSTNTNNRIGIQCDNTECSLTIGNLSASSYHLRVSSIYKDVALGKVVARDGTGAQLRISGAQAVIDSTGRAQDVLRRIQVHVPLRSTSRNDLTDYAIETTGAICKRYSITTGFISSDVTGITSGNPLCQQFTSP
jgi:hypothetical protein